jgi:hypothetical protein
MPRSGYTGITVPIQLKDELRAYSIKNGYSSVPQMIESWMLQRTGTVQVRGENGDLAPMINKPINHFSPSAELSQTIKHRSWCGRRDSDPGRLRGRQVTL